EAHYYNSRWQRYGRRRWDIDTFNITKKRFSQCLKRYVRLKVAKLKNDRYMLNQRRPCSCELIRLTAMLLYAFLLQG
nr:hypothetical protein [Tanacetum cinerariifolium]